MIATVQIERFGLTSSRPCDEILTAIKAAVGHPDMVEFAKRTAAAPSFPEFESIVREGLGTTGLMLFMELDHGAVIRKATGRDKPRMARLIMGNPLIMQQMARHVPYAGSYAPVTVLVDERSHGVHISYDRMASLLASYGSSDALAVARDVDRKWRPFCRKRRVEPTSLCHRNRTGKLRRRDDQSIAVGCFCQCPDSGGHGRPSAWRERNEMVAYFFNAYFGQALCGVGGHGNHSRSKPETRRLDRGEWQEFDGDLRDPWPRRSFLWRKHDSEKISTRAVRRNARGHRCHAKAGVCSCG